MAKETQFFAKFTGGYVSDLIEGRVDIDRYLSSCRVLTNMLPLIEGPATRRGGTKYIADQIDEATKALLLPFEFSEIDNTMLLLNGNGKLQFFTSAGATIVAPDQGVTWTNGDFANGNTDWTEHGGATISGGVCTLNASGEELRRSVTVSNPEQQCAIRWTMPSNLTSTTPQLIFQIGTTAGGNDILNRNAVNDYSNVFMFTPGTGNTTVHFSWVHDNGTATLDNVEFLNDQPLEMETPFVEAELADIDYAQSADVIYLVSDGTRHPYRLIRATEATATGTAASTYFEWRLVPHTLTNAPSDWGTDNYPRVVIFYQSRLWYMSTPQQPDSIWSSKLNAFSNFTTGSNSDDAIAVTIAATKISRIVWAISEEDLIIGTLGAEYALRSSDSREAVAPNTASIKVQTSHKSAASIRPAVAAEVNFFVQRSQERIIEYKYDGSVGKFTGRNLTRLVSDIFAPRIKQMAWMAAQQTILWILMTDGNLVSATYDDVEEVVAFANHTIGGTNVEVESIATMASANGDDRLWMTVKRTVNSATVRYVEIMQVGLAENTTDPDDAWFVDSGLSYSGASTTTLSGLSHLEGETIQVNADGNWVKDLTVSSGSVTLPYAVTDAIAGIGFTSELQPAVPIGGSALGVSKGRHMRVKESRVAVRRSASFEMGPPDKDLEPVPFRKPSDAMGVAVPLQTTLLDTQTNQDFQDDGKFSIKTSGPLPLTVQYIALTMEVVD